MLDPAGKPTPRLRASVLRQELEGPCEVDLAGELCANVSAAIASSCCAALYSALASSSPSMACRRCSIATATVSARTRSRLSAPALSLIQLSSSCRR